ncbi:MAG: VCBS repeat-containing protein, partial [Verrucomicrobiota bacterium]
MKILLLALSFSAVATLTAQEVRLDAPLVLKVDWETRALSSADIDGDGRVDLALINNGKAEIEIFYQLAPGEKPGKTKRVVKQDRWEPQMDDAPFERDKLFTGGDALDLELGDLNGDGLVDVVFANDLEEIVIHYQEAGGEWSKAITTEVEGLAAAPGAMVIADLRGDGKQDLVVVGTNDILVFVDGNMGSPPERFPLAFSGLSTLKVIDADRDGRLDICYGQSLGSETYLVVRAQSEDGQFFGERFIRIEGLTSILKEFGKPG